MTMHYFEVMALYRAFQVLYTLQLSHCEGCELWPLTNVSIYYEFALCPWPMTNGFKLPVL